MPGRLLVDGRLVDDEAQRGISWRRTVLFVVLMLVLIASNPANEGTTARILEKIRLHKTLSKWMGRQLSERSYWNRRTTNYFVLSVKERVAGGLEIGTAFNSMTVCTVEDPEWGFLCRKLKSLISHPGVEWWRLPHDQPPVVLHRVFMVLLAVACGAVVCGVRTHDDPLLSMFVPSTQQNPFTWLMQVYVDSNVLLYPYVLCRRIRVSCVSLTTHSICHFPFLTTVCGSVFIKPQPFKLLILSFAASGVTTRSIFMPLFWSWLSRRPQCVS